MSFDTRWEDIFTKQKWGKYPCEEVIRFIARNFFKEPKREKIKILDLGCGGGATSWFLAREGFDCYGIDGSSSAIKQCKELLKQDNLNAKFQVGDFQKLDFSNDYFDAVCDLNSIQHNDISSIKKIYSEINRVLKPGGPFFSMCLNNSTTTKAEDKEIEPGTYSSLSILNQPVTVHLFSRNVLEVLLHDFKIEKIEKVSREMDSAVISHYLVNARK
jgi:ubiquinone/menaquinone biosynthesis C-methylase UbiE